MLDRRPDSENSQDSLRGAEDSTVELIHRVQVGDGGALETLLARYLPRLRHWARGRLPAEARDLEDTEDLVQDTLHRTMRGLSGFDPSHSGAFAGYLHRGVLNQIRDAIRRARRRPVGESVSHLVAREPSPIDLVLADEERERYESSLEQLDADEREAILARFELSLSWAEVAEVLGKPSADAARVATTRALDKLTRQMGNRVGNRGGSRTPSRTTQQARP